MSERGPLRVEDLCLYFRTTAGVVQAVDKVSLSLEQGQTLAVVGESGCGKTSFARAVLRLLPRNVHTYSGQVFLNGVDVMKLSEERFRTQIRWSRMAFVAQAAMNSLNPVIRVGDQVAEPLMLHRGVRSKEDALEAAAEKFRQVGVPTDFLSRYAFELSGGMRQRVVIAMSLLTQPDLVVLDEPTSALDVLTQANIMNVLKRIKQEHETSFILITHDIATSSELADWVAVMYAGQLVELSPARYFYPEPLQPYSQKLMASVPGLRRDKKLEFIPGQPPSLINPPTGCRFYQRCESRMDRCAEEPPFTEVGYGRHIKCWLYV
jgi:oligopeptide/dipeptide ABC transporter ATP-binding protein